MDEVATSVGSGPIERPRRVYPKTHFAVRVIAFWFGVFTIVNVLGALGNPVFDQNVWWVDLRFLPGILEQCVLVVAGALLVSHALWPVEDDPRRVTTLVALGILALAALSNAFVFYREWLAGHIDPGIPFPLSLLIVGVLVIIGGSVARYSPSPGRRQRLAVAAAVTVLFVVFVPLAQFLFFGTTDYRREADAIVVFGAKVHEGGTPSISLNDRMTTAVELYEAGLADIIIVSGAVGESGDNEAEVMRDMALERGVPAAAVTMDSEGNSTDATVKNTSALFETFVFERVLVVSHFYHLPRIKLAYQRVGHEVFTVPSQSTPIVQMPGIIAREIPAFWLYYVRAILA